MAFKNAGGPAAREKGWKSGNLQEQLRVLLGEAGAAHSDHDCNPQSILVMMMKMELPEKQEEGRVGRGVGGKTI